jgi:hypothetical protein
VAIGLFGPQDPPSLFTVRGPVRPIQNYKRRVKAIEDPGSLLSIRERLGQIYAGPYDPTLDPRQNAAARTRALGTLSAQLFAGANSGRGTFSNIGNALLASQEAGEAGREQQTELQARREALAQQQAAIERQQASQQRLQRAIAVGASNGMDPSRTISAIAFEAAGGNKEAQALLGDFVSLQSQAGARDDRALAREQQQGQFDVARQDKQAQLEQQRLDRQQREADARLNRAFQQQLAASNQQFQREQAQVSNRASIGRDYRIASEPERMIATALTNARGAPKDAFGDQTRVVALATVVQPTANAVQQAEFERLASAGAYGARIKQLMNKIAKSGELDAKTRTAIDAELERIFEQRRKRFETTHSAFVDQAREAGLQTDFLINPFSTTPAVYKPRYKENPY